MPALWKSERGRGSIWPRAKSANLQIRFNLHGREVRESAETSDLETAIRVLNKRLKERDAAELGHDEAFNSRKARRIRVEEVLIAYARVKRPPESNERRAKRRPVRFDGQYRNVKEDFGGRRVLSLTSNAVADYVEERRQLRAEGKPGNSDGSILRDLIMLRAACNYAKSTTPPMLPITFNLRIPEGLEAGRRTGKFTVPEFDALCLHLPDYWQPVAKFGYESGWRSGEIEDLRWEHITGWGSVNAQVTLPGKSSKNGHCRVLMLPGELRALIEVQRKLAMPDALGQPTGYVFHYRGKQFLCQNHRDTWKAACEKAGLGRKLPDRKLPDGTVVAGKVVYSLVHDLRRTVVTDLTSVGVGQSVAMSVSGHKDVQVFERYDVADPQQNPQQVAALLALQQERERQRQQHQDARPVAPVMQPVAPGNN